MPDVSPAIVEELRQSVGPEKDGADGARAQAERAAEEALKIMGEMIDRWRAVRDQIQSENQQGAAQAPETSQPEATPQAVSPEEEAKQIIESLKQQ